MAERHVRHVEKTSAARGRHFGVLKRVALDIGWNDEPCYTSIRTIAAAERCSPNTVAASIRWAAENGELIVNRVGQRNYYSLPNRGNQESTIDTVADDNAKTATVAPKIATVNRDRGNFCENCSNQSATVQLLQLTEKLLRLEKTVAILAETVSVLSQTVAVFQNGRGNFGGNRVSFEPNRGSLIATEVEETLKGPTEVCEESPPAHTKIDTVTVDPPLTAKTPPPFSPPPPPEKPVPAHIRGFNAMYAERKSPAQSAMEQMIAGIVRNPTNREGIADAALLAVGFDLSTQDVSEFFGDGSVFWYQVSHGQRDHMPPYAKNIETELRAAVKWRRDGSRLPTPPNGKNGHGKREDPYSADPEFVEKLNRELNPGWAENTDPIPEIPW